MNIIRFLQEYNIEYIEKGKNVSREDVGINCPFCRMEGNTDPSHHMGIALTGDVYGCWRNSRHSGRKMWRLVAALLHCSYQRAREIAGEQDTHIEHEQDFSKQVHTMIDKKKPENKRSISEQLLTQWNSGFDLMSKKITAGKRYRKYLTNRGFTNLRLLSLTYELRFSTSGKWKNRILFPVRYKDALVAIVGRSIMPNAEYRYLVSDENKNAGVKEFIYCQDDVAQGGKGLFITEGILDCIKLSHILAGDMKVTCAFSNNLSPSQIARISLCAKQFDKTFIVFDRGAESNALNLERTWLRGTATALLPDVLFPKTISDPADLSIDLHGEYIRNVVNKQFAQ